MTLIAKRLPATEETLRFISPAFSEEHFERGIDDRYLSAYGMYCLFRDIVIGKKPLYGVFLTVDGNAKKFFGFELGVPCGNVMECHSFWSKGSPTAACAALVEKEFIHDSAGTGIEYLAGFIPETIRAAKLFALRSGFTDKGISPDRFFYKDGKKIPCRKFIKEIGNGINE